MDRTDAVTAQTDEDVRGPHLWLNWQGMLVGQPARTTSYGESILVHPLWEEHALYSDADIRGEFDFGPYRLMTTFATGVGTGRVSHQLVLRHADHLLEAPVGAGTIDHSDTAGWTGGELGDQMAALLSLSLGSRVRSGGVVRQGFDPGDPLGRPMAMTHRVPMLVEPSQAPMLPGIAKTTALSEAVDLIEGYARLSAADALALTRAAGQYADALWWADADPRIAWIKLVGALEAASNRADVVEDDDPIALLKRHRGKLYGQLKKISSEAARIAAEDLAGTLRAEHKFLAFTIPRVPAPPVERPEGGRVDFNDLEPALRTIYEWRSRDLHDGVPFPQPMCEPPIAGSDGVYERFPALAVQAQGGAWPAAQLPMYLHVFVHVVGGALRSWWAERAGARPQPREP